VIHRVALLGASGVLAMAGCAVLTVDVDVYKGALANHETIQTEQMAAMAMGAKPLLAELRQRLERDACFKAIERVQEGAQQQSNRLPLSETHPAIGKLCPGYARTRATADFFASPEIHSRDAGRVNAVLSLYDDATVVTEILWPLQEAVARLQGLVESGLKVVGPFLDAHPEEADRIATEARSLPAPSKEPTLMRRERGKASRELKPGYEEAVVAVRDAWQAAIDAWRESIRLLASDSYRRRLVEIDPDLLWAVAWVAADLTSAEGLRRFLSDPAHPRFLDEDPLGKLPDLVTPLSDKSRELTFMPCLGVLQAFGASRKGLTPPCTPSGDEGEMTLARRRAQATVSSTLAALLADDSMAPKLAKQLQTAQAYTESRQLRDWFVVFYPTRETLLQADRSLAELVVGSMSLTNAFRAVSATGLEHGRPERGLGKLIQEYLDAKSGTSVSVSAMNDSDRRQEEERRRARLIDGLVNFAEKVTTIANFDPLVRDAQTGLAYTGFGEPDRDKYVRVLQAVGNSILSQVDALRQIDTHRGRLLSARDSELEGIRNAEARGANTLKQIGVEIAARPASFPSREAILSAASGAQKDVDKLVEELARALASQRPAWEAQRASAMKWAMADDVLRRKDVREAAENYGKTVAATTTGDLAAYLIGILRESEAKGRLSGGAGEEEAVRLGTAAAILRAPVFTEDGSSPRSVGEKYLVIVSIAGRERGASWEAERGLATIVGDLERWHAQARHVGGAGSVRLGVPRSVEQGSRASAKDVLDVMLATLRYEHVDAVGRDRNSEVAKNKLAAVELLHAYRSGLIHIRPASTFLRNSYPATVLQKNPSAGVWQNMLVDHAWRQFPPYDWFTRKLEAGRSEINNAIDKQFWQSVNQVRVAGAGRTNYAVAKDDVGNWYVKSYSADPTDIIKSAKNLAMFSAGPALGANFLSRGGSATREALEGTRAVQRGEGLLHATPGGATTSTGDSTLTGPASSGVVTGTAGAAVAAQAPRSTLQRQFDRVSKRYGDDTTKARAKLKDDIQALNARLKATLQNRGVDDTVLNGLFVVPDAKLVEALGKDTQDDRTPKLANDMNKEIVAALKYVRRYRVEVQTRLGAIVDANDPSATPTTKFGKTVGAQAKQDLDGIFKELLDQAVKERQAATAQYDTALLFIGETAGF
jgi:hypothetical protein